MQKKKNLRNAEEDSVNEVTREKSNRPFNEHDQGKATVHLNAKMRLLHIISARLAIGSLKTWQFRLVESQLAATSRSSNI